MKVLLSNLLEYYAVVDVQNPLIIRLLKLTDGILSQFWYEWRDLNFLYFISSLIMFSTDSTIKEITKKEFYQLEENEDYDDEIIAEVLGSCDSDCFSRKVNQYVDLINSVLKKGREAIENKKKGISNTVKESIEELSPINKDDILKIIF